MTPLSRSRAPTPTSTREPGINEFIFYWCREDTLEYGSDRALIERGADLETLERMAKDIIPRLRAPTER